MALSRRLFSVIGLALISRQVLADAGALPANVPLLLDAASGRYVTSVVMGTGQPQTVNFTISTGLRYSAVASTQCEACAQQHAYNPALSTSYQPVNGDASALYGGLDLSGGLMRETCGLVETNATQQWVYTNQTLVLSSGANTSLNLFSDTITGVAGLGTSAPPGGNVLDTLIGKWFNTHPTNETFDFGLALNDLTSTVAQAVSADEEDTGAGRLHMTAANTSFFNATALVWSQAASATIGVSSQNDFTDGYSSDYAFTLNSWTFEGTDSFSISSSSSAQAIFEPLYPGIVFPSRFATSIAASITGSQEVANSNPEQWTVPCDTATIVWTASYNGLLVETKNLVQRSSDGQCTSAIQGWRDDSVTSFLLGAPSMTNAYIIHQSSRNGTNQVGVAPRTPVLLPKRSASSKSGLIGGVVGGVIGGLLLVALAIFIFRKKISRSERIYVAETAPVTPFVDAEPATGVSFLPLGPLTGSTSSPSHYSASALHTSTPSEGGTFAAQQAAAMSQARDAKGRHLFTAAQPSIAQGSVSSPTVSSSAASSVPSSRQPMLPPAYEG